MILIAPNQDSDLDIDCWFQVLFSLNAGLLGDSRKQNSSGDSSSQNHLHAFRSPVYASWILQHSAVIYEFQV